MPKQKPFSRFIQQIWRSRWQPLIAWLVLAVMGHWLIFADPFGLGSASDKAAEKAAYRLTAGLYDQQSSKQILVILFNDRAIDNLYPGFLQANDWPLTYADQANMLTTIMAYQPSAIFYDVMWMKKRSVDNTFDYATEKLKLTKQATDIPLYFAAADSDTLAKNVLLSELSDSVTPVVNAWQGEGESYPLMVEQHPSAAFALYQRYCQLHQCQPDPDNYAESMSVRWSSAVPAPILERSTTCQQAPQTLLSTIFAMLSEMTKSALNQEWMEQTEQSMCPPHPVLYVDEMYAMARSEDANTRQALADLIRDRFVLVGGQIEGVYDYVVSPVHGTLPGVFLHAMALDNLIADDDDYLRETDVGNWWIWLAWCAFVVFLVWSHQPHRQLGLFGHYWITGTLYAVLIAFLSVKWWHLAPGGWLSLLALGWIGHRALEELNEQYWPSKTEQNDES